MAKLLGKAPNQVPTNADLGTMAFQDREGINVNNAIVANLVVTSALTSNAPFAVVNSSANVLYAAANGNVGIGNGTPSAKVLITDSNASGTGVVLYGGGAGGNMLSLTRNVGGTGSMFFSADSSRPQVRFASASNSYSIGLDGAVFKIAQGGSLGANEYFAMTATGNVGIGNTAPAHKLRVEGTASIATDLTVGGNLTVSGTTTYINTTALNIGDNIITLNADLGAVAPSENAGIEVNRGSSANVSLLWDETGDYWTHGNTVITGTANVSGVANFGANVVLAGSGTSGLIFNATAAGAAFISKGTSNSSVSQRLDIINVGSNNALNPMWGGVHLSPPDGAFTNSTAGTGYPRASHYYSYTSTANPTDLTYNIVALNGPTGVGTSVRIYSQAIDTGQRGIDIAANGNIGISNVAPVDTLSVNGTAYIGSSSKLMGKVVINGTTSSSEWLWVQGRSVLTANNTGNAAISRDLAAIVIAPNAQRAGTINNYLPGIAFDHLTNFSAQGNESYNTAHAWVGTRLVSTANGEIAALVLAVKDSVDVNSTTEKLTIMPGGNVGIGNTAPSNKFVVDGNTAIGNSNVTAANATLQVTATAGVGIGANIAAFGTSSAHNRILIRDETSSGTLPPMIASNSAAYGLGLAAELGPLILYSGGTANSSSERMRIASNGNIGIGNVTPNSKLVIQGGAAQADANTTAGIVLDLYGAVLRIGDSVSTAQTYANGVGFKIADSGTAHYSIGQVGGKLVISDTSSDANALYPASRTDIITANNTNVTFNTPVSFGGTYTSFGSAGQTTINFTTSATTANQVVATAVSLGTSVWRTVKYLVSVTSGSAYQATEILIIHDGTNVYKTEYGTVYTGAVLATFDADINSGNIRLLTTPTNAVTTYKGSVTFVAV